MTHERDNIPFEIDPEALLLLGDWDELSVDQREQMEQMGIGGEEFRAMRSVLLESAGANDGAALLKAPVGLKEKLLDEFDQVHGKQRKRGRVLTLRRRRILLAAVAASLVLLLTTAALFLTLNTSDDDAAPVTDLFAQHGTERDVEHALEETEADDEPEEVLMEPLNIEPLFKTPEKERLPLSHSETTSPQVAHSPMTASSVSTDDKMKRAAKADVDDARLSSTEAPAPLPAVRPASHDQDLFRFLYACR